MKKSFFWLPAKAIIKCCAVFRDINEKPMSVILGGALLISACSAAGQALDPPPFDVMNRHHVNMMSGTVAPKFTDVSIGGEMGLSHWISPPNSDFVNIEAGYGPWGPRHKYFGRIARTVYEQRGQNSANWVIVMRATTFDGSHDFKINPGCTMDSAGNALTYNTFVSQTLDPRHILEYTDDKKGFVWTRPDGTRVVFDDSFGAPKCITPSWEGGMIGWGYSRTEYPNGFTISGAGGDIQGQFRTNTGYQLTYIYVARPATDPYYGASKESQPWAVTAADANWGSSVPAYVVAINTTIDYCTAKRAGNFKSVEDACPGLTQKWPFAAYNWPVGMPRVAYLTDRTTTFAVTDAMGRTTKFIHKPFRSTIDSSTERYVPRIYQVQGPGSDIPEITYDYKTVSVGSPNQSGGSLPLYISGPAAQLVSSTRTGGQVIGYAAGVPYGRGGMVKNFGGEVGGGALTVINNVSFGPMEIAYWNKVFSFQTQTANLLTNVYRFGEGVTETYGYDARYNVIEIKENDVVFKSAKYPSSCDISTRKICNKPTWTKDGNGNQTDYEYDPISGGAARVLYPADKNGVRPETRYVYQPKYAFYKRSVGGPIQQADTPVYLLVKESKCLTGAMTGPSSCANGDIDAVVTEYDYGPQSGVGNNLALRGVSVTAYANGVPQTRTSCYSYNSYGDRISETKPKAGLKACY